MINYNVLMSVEILKHLERPHIYENSDALEYLHVLRNSDVLKQPQIC